VLLDERLDALEAVLVDDDDSVLRLLAVDVLELLRDESVLVEELERLDRVLVLLDDSLLAELAVDVLLLDRLDSVLVDEDERLLRLDSVDVLEELRLDSVLVELLELLDSSSPAGADAPPSQKANSERYPAANGHLR
jgi:hypothetical protein